MRNIMACMKPLHFELLCQFWNLLNHELDVSLTFKAWYFFITHLLCNQYSETMSSRTQDVSSESAPSTFHHTATLVLSDLRLNY